jgi:hypothetical protein
MRVGGPIVMHLAALSRRRSMPWTQIGKRKEKKIMIGCRKTGSI